MPSASMAEPAVAPDLECSGCGNPIIKDGQFKCLRCRPKRAVPATLGRRDIVCPRHRQPVVLMRYDRKSGQYRAHCQKSGCLNHDSKTGTIVLPTEEMMTQKTEQTVVEHPPAGGSKTQELRDWLDREIFRSVEDVRILTLALQGVDTPHNIVDLNTYKARYFGLTSDERERKIREDRKKLEELKARLEKLKSARALDVDLDALEESLRTVRQSSWRDDIIRSQRPWSVRLDLKNELIE